MGVDLDLDGLVTEAAPLDALRQRFGRVNRAGRPIEAAGAILTTTESVAKRTDDPIYADRLRNTWEALATIATREHVDFGVGALDQRLRAADIDAAAMAELVAPRARAPTLMPAYLDLWVQTSPPPAADPEVDLFLHGTERSSPEVSIVWRVARPHRRRLPVDEALEPTVEGADKLEAGSSFVPGVGTAAQRGDDRGADMGRGSVAAALEHGARRPPRRRAGARRRSRSRSQRDQPLGVPVGGGRRSAHRCRSAPETCAICSPFWLCWACCALSKKQPPRGWRRSHGPSTSPRCDRC